MQIQDDRFQHIFAVGDVADHTDVKTGHYAWMQGLAALTNIKKLISGAKQEELEPYKSKDLALIKLILGQASKHIVIPCTLDNLFYRKKQ